MLVTMKWKCLNCNLLFSKHTRRTHEIDSGHIMSSKGLIIKEEDQFHAILPEPKAYHFFEWTGNAKKDYPKIYNLFEKLNEPIKR